MQDLNDLYYYVKSIDYGGFAPASRALGIPKSKLSRRIALLEERLRVRLIQRTTRHFIMTEIGHTYYEHCKAMLIEAELAQEAIDSLQSEVRGTIRLSCPVTLLHANVSSILAQFMTKYPLVTIYLDATNRPVDLFNESVDIAIRVRPPPLENSDLVMRTLAERKHSLVASPKLVQQFGYPTSPEELSQWPSLGLGRPQEKQRWTLVGPNHHQMIISHIPRFVTTDMIALRQAAIDGIGVVQLPELILHEQLEDRSLVRVIPNWNPHQEIIYVVFPSRRGLLPSIRALIDYLSMRFANIAGD